MKDAADLVITAQAIEIARRRLKLKADLRDLDTQLMAFNATGCRLPPELETNPILIPANLVNDRVLNENAPIKMPLAQIEEWKRRHAALVAGTDLENAAIPEVAA